MRAEEQGEMSASYLSIVRRATFGFPPPPLPQLFKLVHRLLQMLPFHGNDMKRILSENAVLAAELKIVTFHRTLQKPAKIKLDNLIAM